MDVAAHRDKSRAEPSDDVEPVQDMACVAQAGVDGCLVRLFEPSSTPPPIEALLDRGSITTDPSRASTPTSGPSTPHIPRFREGSAFSADGTDEQQPVRHHRSGA